MGVNLPVGCKAYYKALEVLGDKKQTDGLPMILPGSLKAGIA